MKGIKFVASILIASSALGICSCTKPPKNRTVESIAEERVIEDSRLVSVEEEEASNGHLYYHYVFESRERDLTYEIIARPVTTGFGGYWEDICYDEGVRDYYRDDVMKVVEACPFYMDNPKANLEDDILFYIDTDEDAREVARVLAKCNEIVSDQFNYTPDADLTDPKIMKYKIRVIPGNLRDKVFSYSDYDAYVYVLNGLDDEEKIYNRIRNNVNPDT